MLEKTSSQMLEIFNDIFGGLSADKLLTALSYDPTQPMIFCSGLFLLLFLGFSLVYNLLRGHDTPRLAFVTLFSYYFYYKSSGLSLVLLAAVTIVDYLVGKKLYGCSQRQGDTAGQDKDKDKAVGCPAGPDVGQNHAEGAGADGTLGGEGGDTASGGGSARRKLLLLLSVTVNLGLLAYFKYTNLFYSTYCQIAGEDFNPLNIVLPVGISFFTFQSMSYTIDIYRGKIRPVESLLKYAFYVSFFPQLVAGPIVRASDFLPQIGRRLMVTEEMFGRGLFLIAAGLIKKAIISDYISVNFVDRIFDNPSLYSGIENLMGVYGYTLQIYCDFSGYSDMAIGIALLLGYEFPLNFNSPYKSHSITDFWARWHISLSSWLKDYLYISLGGNRKGRLRTYFNLMATMLLGGLWHGASWNFVLWGGMHGLGLVAHKIWMKIRHKDKSYQPRGIVRLWSVFVTFHFVCLCWILFRARSLECAGNILYQIFFDFRGYILPQLLTGYSAVFALIALGYTSHFIPDKGMGLMQKAMTRLPLPGQVVVLLAVIWCVIQVKGSDVVPFIYFQF